MKYLEAIRQARGMFGKDEKITSSRYTYPIRETIFYSALRSVNVSSIKRGVWRVTETLHYRYAIKSTTGLYVVGFAKRLELSPNKWALAYFNCAASMPHAKHLLHQARVAFPTLNLLIVDTLRGDRPYFEDSL